MASVAPSPAQPTEPGAPAPITSDLPPASSTAWAPATPRPTVPNGQQQVWMPGVRVVSPVSAGHKINQGQPIMLSQPQQQRMPSSQPQPPLRWTQPAQPAQPRIQPPNPIPPGTQANSQGFPSPGPDHATINPKHMDDVARLTYAVQQSLGTAVRRVIRDNWERCLLGSEFHQAFVLNASIHHATPAMLKRAIRDFGSKIVTASKTDLLEQFSQTDLDEVADTILAKASHSFLDKALEKRLTTIEAKQLIKALSRAERLGYESNDMVEEDAQHQERVVSSDRQALPAHSGLPPSNPSAAWQCSVCYRTFAAESAYKHHVGKQVCTRAPSVPDGFKHSCSHCGQGFTTSVGLQYHLNNKVCGDFGPTPAQERFGVTESPVTSSPAPQVAPYASTPTVPRVYGAATPPPAAKTPEVLGRTTGGVDPYAHLTSEQRASLNQELLLAEASFAERFKAASALADPDERRVRLDGLRNSFGTKQSMIRKKYGVRLRERRTKAEIAAERERMGRQGESVRVDANTLQASRQVVASRAVAAATGSPAQSQQSRPEPNRVSTTPAQPAAAAPPQTSGWTTANAHGLPKRKMQDHVDAQGNAKRRRVDGEGSDDSGSGSSTTPESDTDRNAQSTALFTAPAPEAANEVSEDDETDSDDSSDDDEDIPAVLPAAVRQSLSRPDASSS